MSFLRRIFGGNDTPADDVFQRLRQQVLSVTPDALGLAPTPSRPNVWAALMEWRLGEDVAMLVVIADGTVSLYLSTGGGVIGAGQHEMAQRAAEGFLVAAEEQRHLFAPSRPMPDVSGEDVRFHLRTFQGELTAHADERSLAEGRHPLSGLFDAAQFVITALRQLAPAGAEVVPEGPPPGTPMTLLTATPPDHEERVADHSPNATTIARTVAGLSWDDITFVILQVDGDNRMEGSGSLNPTDGLSARVVVNGEVFISRDAPASLDDIVALLQSYRLGDGRWREMIEWS